MVDDQTVVAEDDGRPQVWPEGIPFIKGLVQYKPAQWTQEIAVTDGRDRISKVHRSLIEDQHLWGQPGGMFGIRGWKSDLYKYVPEGGSLWIGNIGVKNSFGYYQPNRGHKRSYPDGTIFVDVLSNAKTGKVFEKRIREKQSGLWQSYISFKKPEERPIGYHGLKQSCVSCHKDAGSGKYGVGLVPGGDQTLSDPLPFE